MPDLIQIGGASDDVLARQIHTADVIYAKNVRSGMKMRDVISIAINSGQTRHSTNGQTRWKVTFVNNETWVGPIEKLGNAYVIYDDEAPIYFSADQVIYLTMTSSEPSISKYGTS